MNFSHSARIAGAAVLLFFVGALTSCETTGDPTQGALFGWSEQKAQARLDQRRAQLGQTQRNTDHINESNWKLHAQREGMR